jgi:hypothetical protein
MSALHAAKGTFTAGAATPSQRVGGLGFAPRAVIAWWTRQEQEGVASGNRGGLAFWAGAATAAVAWASDDGASPTRTLRLADSTAFLGLEHGSVQEPARAQLASFDQDGFTLSWETRPEATWIVHFLALGGPAVTGARVGWLTPNVSLEAARRDLLLFTPAPPELGAPSPPLSIGIGAAAGRRQAAAGYLSRNGTDAGEVAGAQRDDVAIVVVRDTTAPATFGRTVRRGLRDVALRWSPAEPQVERVAYLALEGVRCKVGVDVSPPSPATKATDGIGFRPDALLFFSWGLHAKRETTDIGRLCIGGATSPVAAGCAGWDDRDVDARPSTTHVSSSTSDVLIVTNTQTGGIHAAAALASIDRDGFTLDWTSSDGLEREFAYVALAARDRSGLGRLLARAY